MAGLVPAIHAFVLADATRYRALALNAIGDMCRATRLAIMGAVVAGYFLKCAVARWASRAAALS